MRERMLGVLAAVLVAAGTGRADVFHMGPGLTSIQFVTVGNPGNAADTRFTGHYTGVSAGSVSYVYGMGQFEVTNAQYTLFLNAVAKADPYQLYDTRMWSESWGCKIQRSGSSGNYSYSVASDRANRPVDYISWGDAARFVNWLANGQPTGPAGLATTEDGSYYLNGGSARGVTRKQAARYVIPTEDEWYKAAYHQNDGVTPNYWSFPACSNSVPGNVLAFVDSGNNVNCYDSDKSDRSTGGYTLGSPYWTTDVASFQHSASPYGTFDQGGNIEEWTETIYYNDDRIIRGGMFNDNVNAAYAAQQGAGDGSYSYYDTGFRIAYLPEPGCAFVLLLGAAAAFRRRRRVAVTSN